MDTENRFILTNITKHLVKITSFIFEFLIFYLNFAIIGLLKIG